MNSSPDFKRHDYIQEEGKNKINNGCTVVPLSKDTLRQESFHREDM